ncbi:uncharacterized protein LOC110031052 isoform X2 [Phalaenopsis equestris]|uniref:uncharacterized protein LOC110031052 isoform X2 n=1 Tax=Phalaenopsis equestris TaxID=78828 RepID=UPI0009E3CBBC|nr:uncharacterized protein LOC110031052 isoform X2 [Phalaenopsis equestris]
MMTSKANGSIQRSEKLKHVEEASPNWVIIVGGALLSTLSIRLCCKLKQAFEVKKSTKTHVSSKGISNSASGGKYAPISPMSKDGDDYLSMVKVPSAQSSMDNVRPIQGSLLDRFELPLSSNNLDSPCISESGSDIYSKREVMQKLQQQIKRRDDMIIEMQAQITFLQNSLNVQMAHTTHLQAQLDSSYRELFYSEREIKRIQKAIADHCACNIISLERPSDAANGHAEEHHDDYADAGLLCIGFEKSRGEDVIEMLRKSVEEMKEVIKGKDFLIQSYKEQKMELCSKMTELQLRLPSQQILFHLLVSA